LVPRRAPAQRLERQSQQRSVGNDDQLVDRRRQSVERTAEHIVTTTSHALPPNSPS
jgi:hypothetical protein